MNEQVLKGGQTADSVVKIGNNVHKTVIENSEFVHRLLKLLEEKGYPYSPRFLGLDETGREILSFIEGETIRDTNLTDAQLKKVVNMLKEFHDATEGWELTENLEVVCHNDLAPWNTIIKDNKIVGFIDFDGAKPGNRVDDLAYLLWTFLDLGSGIDVEMQIDKIKMLCDEYGFYDGESLVNAVLKQQKNVIDIRKDMIDRDKEVGFNRERIELIKKHIKWVEDNRDEILQKF